MRQPEIYSAATIRKWSIDRELPSGKWVPCRPVPANGHDFLWRFQLAWLVFTGRCDALGWQDHKAKD